MTRGSETEMQWRVLLERLGGLLGSVDSDRLSGARLDTSVQHATLPVSSCIDVALALCVGPTAHVRAPIEGVKSQLHWRRNAAYSNSEFLDGYGYCELIGPAGHVREAAFALGLLLLAPHVTYPEHAHPARETYVVVAGHAQWRQGDRVWRIRVPGERIEHAANEPHAMRTEAEPLLAAYLWHDHLHEGARLTG